jgi:hypothetical protein
MLVVTIMAHQYKFALRSKYSIRGDKEPGTTIQMCAAAEGNNIKINK